ncbi:MAG: sulfurtransferase TusA family protein [Deltaproteobacteria bacterium]|nr:sulfurtransferase TusA family protein [Deltaproteobacteria bacterium]
MNAHVDLRGTVCPMNLLKAKLALEPLAVGDTLEILLDPGEGMENVPQALEAAGHEILLQKWSTSEGAPCTLHIRKGAKKR